jgi:catechol 2,3-dioxygenase-like lactoylglutathione lyase family enzyme
MTLRPVALCIDANDHARLAHFWAGVLGRELDDDPDDGLLLLPSEETDFRIEFQTVAERKTAPNQMHFDLTSTSLEDQQATVQRALALGGRHIDVGQLPDEEHVVLADPEGNEFCVIEPGNAFLDGCGVIGALSCDGLQEVGYFWSEALGWPLVWDQDGETAIQSPRGGSKITWDGPPLASRTGKNRLHLDLAPGPDGDQQAEVDRLVSFGAQRADIGQGDVSWEVLADPGGNVFCVLSPQ